MSATLSHLQLNSYFLKEISYSIKDNLDKIPVVENKIEPIGLEIADITTPLDDEHQNWRCELIIQSPNNADSENDFYNFKIVMVGFFTVNPNLPPEQAKILAESNSPAVLYSTSREIIATITRRSPYPAVLLPLVTFVKVGEKPKQAKKPTKKKSA